MKRLNRYFYPLLFISSLVVNAQQVNISRIELMPNKPASYQMRNWKNTALGYDSFVYNYNLTGQYLPLITDYSNTINYTNHESFGLPSVVGPTDPNSFEAINVLPS